MTDFRHVAVLGFGTMGAGIAQLVARSGRTVTVLDTDEERLRRGGEFVADFLRGGVERGKHTPQERDDILNRINGVTEVEEISGADLVIEAVTERSEVKRLLFQAVAEVVREDTVLVTNTSALSVTDLASATPGPQRFAGLHFFNPAPVMKLVEIVRALQSSPEVVSMLEDFVDSLGKQPVVVKDRPGFLVNRLLMPYLNDVVQAYDDGLASADDIDTAIELGLGHKLGPLGLLDVIGLDVHQHATTSAYESTHDPRFAAPPLLQQMVSAGFLGKKSGTGFRTGSEDRR